MRIAVIDTKDFTLKLENNSIKYEEHTIPFALIDILILNHRVMLSSKDIIKLNKENITILLISYNNENITIINSANTKNGDLKLAQYNSLQDRVKFAKYFIANKIKSHHQQLQTNNEQIDIEIPLSQLEKATKLDEIMGIEGSFAREYFSIYFSLLPKNLHKSKRSKNPPLDPVNAVLSFWYSLFYNIITVKLLSYGFEPAMGYLHTPFRSHNALSSDIMEFFRADINQAVYSIFKYELLSTEDFHRKGGVYLSYDGRMKIWKEFVALVNVLKPKLDNEIANIRGMINGKDIVSY